MLLHEQNDTGNVENIVYLGGKHSEQIINFHVQTWQKFCVWSNDDDEI